MFDNWNCGFLCGIPIGVLLFGIVLAIEQLERRTGAGRRPRPKNRKGNPQ